MKKTFLVVFFIIVVSSFLFSNFQEPLGPKNFAKNKTITNYSTLFYSYKIIRYPTSIEIKPIKENATIGFATDPWNLNFGIIPANGSFVKRNIELFNSEKKDVKIILKSFGNISSLVFFSKNNFVLHPQEKVKIDVFLFSNDTLPGNYSGEIDLIIKKPIYNFLPIT